MRAPNPAFVLVVGALVVCGCRSDPAPNSAAPSVAEVSGAAPSVSATARPATSAAVERNYDGPELTLSNMQRLVDNAERAIARGSKDMAPRLALVGLLSERASRLGRVSDLDRVAKLGAELSSNFPKQQRAWLAQARAHNTVHRFEDALAALAEAKKHGAQPSDTRLIRASASLGVGDFAAGHALIVEQRKLFASPTHLALEAIALGRLGRTEQAEQSFGAALTGYRDVSPLLPSWIHFERGNMWLREDNESKARAAYGQAVKLVPQYAHAAAHLAAISPKAEAIGLLEPLLKSSNDPEYPASLASLLRDGDAQRSSALRDQAKRGYEQLLAKHEAAFADHAAWFFMELPDGLARAHELAIATVAARPGVPEVHELRLAVALRRGQKADVCGARDAASKLPHKTAGLKLWLLEADKLCVAK